MNKKKWACTLFFPLLFARGILGQEGGTATNQDDLYSRALLASLDQMHKEWGHIHDTSEDTVRTDYNHMIVKANPEITGHLPTQFGEHHVEYLDAGAQIQRYRKLKKQFPILEIHPIHGEGAQLTINVSLSYVSYKKGHLFYGLSDWSDVEFHFDCDKHRFTVSSVKLGGI